jgi:hypothetical protein
MTDKIRAHHVERKALLGLKGSLDEYELDLLRHAPCRRVMRRRAAAS